jgi:hypothetical protein
VDRPRLSVVFHALIQANSLNQGSIVLRKISLYVFAVLVIGFSISATATGAEDFGAETLYQGRNELGENIYLIRYHEEGFWRVQVIVQHADGWQDV